MLKDEANNTVSESYARAKVAFLYPLKMLFRKNP